MMDTRTADDHAHHTIRVEDDILVRGAGHFVDDVHPDNEAFAAFVRSPHAHARIRGIDTSAALAAPGILAVLTNADMEAAGVGNTALHPPLPGRNGGKLVHPFRPALAKDRVMHVGQTVAAVIGRTQREAVDAVELVAVDYEELPSVTDTRAALKPGAPQLWPEAPSNLALDWVGLAPEPEANAREVDRIIASAPHVARLTLDNQRLVVNAIETRGATGSYDPATDSYTLRSCSQGALPMQQQIAVIMKIEPKKLRVISEEVGGAFGLKTSGYPEYPVLLVAARKVGRPVHWMSTRTEGFLSDNQARDTVTAAELAFDESGRFLALRVKNVTNLGGFLATTGAHLATNNFTRCLPGMYDIPLIDVNVRCVFTNTVPTGPYRGAGRPEANYMIERLVDEASRINGIDPVKLRRRNIIQKSKIPYKTAVGTVYDSGEFATVFGKAMALADYKGFNRRRRASKKRGRLRGIGISCFLEHSGGNPTEGASLSFPGGETLVLGMAVQNTGQGHATVFPRLVAERLGIKPEQVTHRHGDTNLGINGFASVGSRSAMTAGSAIVKTIAVTLEKGRKAAAHMLEASEPDIAYRDGFFEVVGTDRRLSLFEVAARAKDLVARGELKEALDSNESVDTPQTFPNGCHIAEVEVDPDTGHVEVISYSAVDDAGNVLDSTIVHGQLHGGLAQGLGQALLEGMRYDPDNGQAVSASFMDYAMPRAEHMPDIRDAVHIVPATTNPLGVKGVGEAGTTASIAAILNAIRDAIPGEAGARIDMPATPAKVWAAVQQARSSS
ncbi:MAG: molybdopterin-dependent oxidoreductase [Rhizobiales bacterium]|nr:molybdopterin-dependent oxidoreductase [Hyphomicrobiales bacterium]